MHQKEDHIQQLAGYFKKNLSKGYTPDSLKFSLMNQGYSRISIDKSLELANEQLAKIAPILKEKPQITYRIYPEIHEKEDIGFFKKILKRFFKNL
ncbi:MAG: hypothetical protein Q8N99_03650 [Nanoarchaeota archaeon]|nr:hypothetical protein [Nanoarchaeota archaeon]